MAVVSLALQSLATLISSSLLSAAKLAPVPQMVAAVATSESVEFLFSTPHLPLSPSSLASPLAV
jgi:hypothetical protein